MGLRGRKREGGVRYVVQNWRQVKEMVEVSEVWTEWLFVSKIDKLRITQCKNYEVLSVLCVAGKSHKCTNTYEEDKWSVCVNVWWGFLKRSQLWFPHSMWSAGGDRQANTIWTRPSKHMYATAAANTVGGNVTHQQKTQSSFCVSGRTRLNLSVTEKCKTCLCCFSTKLKIWSLLTARDSHLFVEQTERLCSGTLQR